MSAINAGHLIGHQVEIELGRADGCGVTLRWGTLVAVIDDQLIVDDYHDSAGIGAYLPGRGCSVRDGVPIGLYGVRAIRRAGSRNYR
jgi:hypothetical protein